MTSLRFWLIVGFTGQLIFTARFLVQWAASERKGRTVVPTAFWWLSLLGGGLTLLYAMARRDPVVIMGQAVGMAVYARSLAIASRGQGARAGACSLMGSQEIPNNSSTASPTSSARISVSPTSMA